MIKLKIHDDLRPLDIISNENISSKKIFIQYPIKKICNYRCPYCFHKEFFDRRPDSVKYENTRGFELEQFKLWMDTHIYPNFNEIVIHFSGGEPLYGENLILIQEVIDICDNKVKFDFLTNGSFNCKNYLLIFNNSARIYRLGLTFHRNGAHEPLDDFRSNALAMRMLGIPVYIKELLWKDHILDILKAKKLFTNIGFQFKIQDVQNLDGSPNDYEARDLALIDDEYKHQGKYCSCWQGYRSISIRGYDIAAGNVIACWLDPKIIGNVADNTLNLNFIVNINELSGNRNVSGGNFDYSKNGTFDKDRKSCEH